MNNKPSTCKKENDFACDMSYKYGKNADIVKSIFGVKD